MEQSDETRVWLCRICGLPALVMSGSSNYTLKKECRVCESNDVVLVRMPYATKLLMQTLSGLNVLIRVLVDPHGSPQGTIENSKEKVVKIYANDKKIGECKIESVE